MGQSNAALLASLQGHPGYECVQALSVVDINLKVKKKSFKISYDLRDITWLMDPPATKGIKVPLPDILDEFGLWQKSTKRHTTDRFFTPNEKDETKEDSLTCPPAACADLKFKKPLESKLLGKSITGGKKYLDLPVPFYDNRISFKEIPLFAITEHHAKLSLGNLAAMSQVCTWIHALLLIL